MPPLISRRQLAAVLILAAPGGMAAQTWVLRVPVSIRQTGRLTDPRLRESSAAARGVRNPGVFWTVNDSGNEPVLFAVDTTGAVRAALPVAGARNIDWEALAAAPCGSDTCLYIGDVGDNYARRRSLVIYRVVEPPLDGVVPATVPVRDSVAVTLAGGPQDVEAMVVTHGDIALISKGWSGPPSVHWVPGSAWQRSGPIEARQGAALPIATGLLRGRVVTDAALSPGGDRLAVRTYREIFLWRRGEHSGELPDEPEMSCDIAGREPLGEGITWWDDTTLLLTSERALLREGTILMVRCDP